MSDLYADPRRDTFLSLEQEERRGPTTNVLLGRARAGAATPSAIYYAAIEYLRERLGGWGTEDPNVRALLSLLLRHRAEAIAFCAWCLDWERLSPSEKARLKAARGEEHRQAWMDTQPATPKQVAYCRSLGHVGPIRSRAHASEIIDTLKQRRAS